MDTTMQELIPSYQQRLNLHNAVFSRIEHEDATVAMVYHVHAANNDSFILKICTRPNDYYNEFYFLTYFANKIPVPRIISVIEPDATIYGAILMEYIPGNLLQAKECTQKVAFEIGSLLAKIHLNRTPGYGNLTKPDELYSEPQTNFLMKFEEGLEECSNHLPQQLIEKCRTYFHDHLKLLDKADGPCITHRDFRAGNVIVKDDKVQAIIDWSSARGGFAQEDFCNIEYGTNWPFTQSTKQAFLDGYASIRPIAQYHDMLPLLCLSRTIAIIGFTVKRDTWQTRDARIYQFNRQYLEDFFKSR